MSYDELLKQINDRLEAIGQSVSEQRLKALVAEQFNLLLADESFARKMRFARADKPIIGSKFARWNLSVADIEFLYDLMNTQRNRGLGGPSEELENTFKAVSDAIYLPMDEIRRIDRQAIDNLFPRVHKGNRAQYEAAIRAMDTAESGYGAQLVGAQYVGSLWEAAHAESRVARLIGSFEMTAPTAFVPVEADFPEMLYVSESPANDSANYATSKTGSQRVAIAAKKFVIHQMWSGELEEDSIVPFVPFLRGQAQKSLSFYMDSLLLNGDTTTSNGINSSSPAETKHYLAADGIRHAALVDNPANSASAGGDPVDLALFASIYGRMLDATYKHDWGHPNNPNDLVHVVDPWVADRLMMIPELLTVDKFGANAAVLNGQVARVFTHPVIASIALSKTTATGKVDDDPEENKYGQIVSFNVNAFRWGWRRRVQLETERRPATDQNRIVYSLRIGLGRYSPTGASDGIEAADVVYYIGL